MKDIVLTILFSLALVLPMFIAVGALSFVKKRDARRVHPLTKSLRRAPGHSLVGQLINQYFELTSNLALLSLGGSFPIAIHFFQSYVLGKPESPIRTGMTAALIIAWVVFFSVRLVKCRKAARNLRLGYECELAVGQELDQLLGLGWRVFHDVPGESFNIDHIVVGAGGAFAIETKGRSKKSGTRGDKAEYRVDYENGRLKFPDWTEDDPITQVQACARWVSQWLSQATGFPVTAQPLVVLPGWYVIPVTRNPVPVLAAGALLPFFSKQENKLFTRQQVTQICYQIDQRTRDVQPGTAMRPT